MNCTLGANAIYNNSALRTTWNTNSDGGGLNTFNGSRFGYLRAYGGDTSTWAMVAGSSFAGQSDGRLKDEIPEEESDIDVDAVLRLKPFHYRWNNKINEDDDYYNEESHFGFDSRDVADIAPDMVLFDDGEPIGVDYGKFTPYLLAFIQRQQKQIDKLSQRIDKLTNS